MDDRSRLQTDECSEPKWHPQDVILRSPPNWTAVIFLAALGMVHLGIAIPSFLVGRWEAYLSLIFGCGFLLAASVCRLVCREIAILPARKAVRIRTGCPRAHFFVERTIEFGSIQGVRVTLERPESRVELLCEHEDIECPPTPVPRQEALLLAISIDVPLIKVMDANGGGGGEDASPASDDDLNQRLQQV